MAKRWYFKDNKFFRNPLVVGDKQIVNPTHEQLIAEGWEVWKPPTPSDEVLQLQEIERLKTELERTDYQAIKFAEGWLTAEEYAPIKAQRQVWREQINELEKEVNND